MPDLFNCEFGELIHTIPAAAPVDSHTSGVTGLWVSMKEYQAVRVVVNYAAGTASDEVAITVNQATSSTGAGSKACSCITRVRKMIGATAIGQSHAGVDTVVTQAAASTYTPSGESADQAIYMFEVRAEQLDVANNFDYMQVTVGTPANARLCAVSYDCFRPHHPQTVPVSPLS